MKKGVFNDDMAMMAHPCFNVCPAVAQVKVTYGGKAAHAATFS